MLRSRGQALALRKKNATLAIAIVRVIQRSRGTGPRATKKNAALSRNNREGQALALRGKKRHPRATEKKTSLHRRARACPSPCGGLPKTREGQALALR